MSFLKKGWGLLFWIFVSGNAWAFPEMVRHGYVNCTACHVSPAGGGLLTAYGRELSRELLSTWGQGEANAKDSGFAHQFNELPEGLHLGGDIRAAQLYRDTSTFRSGKFFFMQGDLEAGVVKDKWAVVASAGLKPAEKGKEFGELISRSHYALYRLSDELTLRGGRFFPVYGIRTPDHLLATKQNLRLQQPAGETYNFEASYLGEKWNLVLTGIFGRPDHEHSRSETGVAAQGSIAWRDSLKAGWSFLHADGPSGMRNVTGPFGILGFTPKFFLLAEWDWQSDRSGVTGFAYHRLDYELLQGLHGYLTYEMAGNTESDAYGLGVQFFPRSHFELNLSWQVRKEESSPESENYAWLLLHYYL
jgi:hypothetical protein